jgi:hypothetical protein
MPQIEIYKSANGEGWFLCRNESGHVYVVHEPSEASGGKSSFIGLGDFLSSAATGPEHEALLHMIGSLVERPT